MSLEKSVKKNPELAQYVGDVKVPIEEVVEMREGKKRNVKKKFFPGYVLIEIDLPEASNEWKKVVYAITHLPGVTGFLGSTAKSQKPNPISNEDAKKILQKTGDIKVSESILPKFDFSLGETVKVVDGPFANFNGMIEGINHEKGKLTVKVEIFGRSTPVELDFLQVQRI